MKTVFEFDVTIFISRPQKSDVVTDTIHDLTQIRGTIFTTFVN